jgi:hypothetical protein
MVATAATVAITTISHQRHFDFSDFPKFRLRPDPNQLYMPAVPPLLEGRFAIVTDVGGGMRWTRWRF